MDFRLEQKCELFVQNRNTIKNVFKWESGNMSLVASLFFTSAERLAQDAQLRQCERILKERTGAFSDYRGNVKIPLVAKMALADDPAAWFDGVDDVYCSVNRGKWFGSEYKILAAMNIYEHAQRENTDEAVEKMFALYKRMKEEHPFLTSDEDMPLAAMLACYDMDTDALVEEMELCFSRLKKDFFSGNSVQSLSHVLALCDKPVEEKCRKVREIYDALRREKRKYGTSYDLATLGILAMLDKPAQEIAAEIVEIDTFLKGQKGFGGLSLDSTSRLMFAAMLLADFCMPQKGILQKTAMGSMLSAAIAMQIAMIMMVNTMIIMQTTNNS